MRFLDPYFESGWVGSHKLHSFWQRMLRGSNLPESITVAWKSASKEGKTALSSFARLADRSKSDRDVAWLESIHYTKDKVGEALEGCQKVGDNLVSWLERRRRTEPVAQTECLGVIVEAFLNEITMRHQISLSLGLAENENGYHSAVVAWKLTPFLSSDKVAVAMRELKFHEEIDSLEEIQARHG